MPKQPFLEVQDHMEETLNRCATRDKIPFPKLLSNKSILKDHVNETVSKLWQEQRGMVIESIALVDLTLDEKSRARVEQFDSAKVFSEDPASLNALVALGFTDAMKAAASNPAGAMTGFAGVGMANSFAGNTATINTQSFEGLESCPFCGSSLNSGVIFEYCPACNADIRSYYQH